MSGREHRHTVDANLADRRLFQAGDRAKRRGLAATGRSEQSQLLTGHDFKADPAHGRHAAVIKFKAINLDMRGR